ncbi:MAG: NifB/NifX family molybdenum-iron cluster-binding protein [Desulforhabdus sp.]|jgi:predicted Fe-Mo cluster-binding NifX family protein|nr:NifB/NifX family molybdenum-iron cluster-binding protein [Desulforhabdus sp.]
MQIALSANRPSIEGEIDPRFGRCHYFIFVDPETMQFDVEANPSAEAASGAGINTAQFVANRGAKILITGNIGPNAYEVLAAAGIEMFTGVSGKIRDVIEIYKSGDLKSTSAPNATMGMGRGMGQGVGMGRGMGCGRGRGRGLGGGQNVGTWQSTSSTYQATVRKEAPDDEISQLKNQAENLAEELAKIQRRIEQIESRQ